MFSSKMILRKKSENLLVLSTSHYFRIPFFFIGLLFIYILNLGNPEQDNYSNTIPIIVIAICVLSGLYYESWNFNSNEIVDDAYVESRFGILPLFIKKKLPFEDIDSIVLSQFTKGSIKLEIQNQKRCCHVNHSKLSIQLKSGKVKTIEILNSKHRLSMDLELKARKISSFCSKPLKYHK